MHFHTDYLGHSLARRQDGALRDDDARAAGLAGAGADLSHVPRGAADLDLGLAARSASGTPTGREPCITAFRSACTVGPGAQRLPRVRRADLAARSASTARSRSRCASACRLKVAAKIDGKDRDYYENEIKPLFAASAGRIRGRDRRGPEERVPGRRGGAAVPDRLAGAVRPGDDRGDGVRHAGGRVPLRLGARGDARRRVRVRRRDARRGGGRHGARREAAARGRPRVLREALLGATDGGGLRRDLRGDVAERAPRPAGGADTRRSGWRRSTRRPSRTAATRSMGWAAMQV